ncbi:hypothetical protein B7P43_G07553 [Cryptotermes secundus]|uniref:Mitochondria-eating protein n=1 Tax=Cryptotermes secundus TaxID=105785 RepID=A0A2J7QI00_9NEOP|nr:hypothetical protein B7P43_G07553 [Cryptotermes secundus]
MRHLSTSGGPITCPCTHEGKRTAKVRCKQVLELMKEVAEDEDDSSDISGYHSDSDSAIMMSGNSPYVSKRARYNFLSRSVRSSTKSSSVRTSVLLQQLSSSSGDSAGQRHQGLHHCSSGSDSPPHSLLVTDPTDCTKGSRSPDSSSTSSANSHSAGRPVTRSQIKHKNQLHKLNSAGSNSSCGAVTCCQGCQSRASLQVQPSSNDEELMTLRGEIRRLQTELGNTNARLQESEQQLKERLASPSASTEAPSDPGSLVRCYGNLYAAARVDALDSLDNLPALKDADELKSKILFSVVVLAFRSAQSLLALKKDHVRRILHIQPPAVTPQVGTVTPSDPEAAELERSVAVYLRKTVDKFDLTKSVEDVCCQIWATLYDYPCLKSCPGLVQYVKDAVRLAWGLVNQSPPFILEYEQRTLRRDVHVRFHSSNPESDQIRTYLWPALLEGAGGPCVHKAVVIT